MAVAALTLLAAAALLALGLRALVWRERRLDADEAEIASLRRVLARSGEPAAPGLTLRQLELRLEGNASPAVARYLGMLRARRYGPQGGSLPDDGARRQLRRALVRGRGLRARLGALMAMPPLSFRRG
jgi:hypothetical protein